MPLDPAAPVSTDPAAAPAAASVPAASTEPASGGAGTSAGAELSGAGQQPGSAPETTETPPANADDALPGGSLQKRINELTRRAREAERRAAEAEQQSRLALEALNRGPAPGQQPNQPEPELSPPEFHTPEQFQQDMAIYTQQLAERTAREMLRAERAREQQEAQQQTMLNEQERIRTTYQARVEKARTEMPDFDEVAGNPDIPISVPLAATIAQHENGPQLAYFLGKNPAEAARIHALPVPLQLVELGVLAYRLKNPAPAPTSRATPPITPVRGGSAATSRSIDEMSMEEYAAQRRTAAH